MCILHVLVNKKPLAQLALRHVSWPHFPLLSPWGLYLLMCKRCKLVLLLNFAKSILFIEVFISGQIRIFIFTCVLILAYLIKSCWHLVLEKNEKILLPESGVLFLYHCLFLAVGVQQFNLFALPLRHWHFENITL